MIDKKYAEKTYILSRYLAKKYSKRVKFSEEIFPDFNPQSIKKVKVKNLEGDSYYDLIKLMKKLDLIVNQRDIIGIMLKRVKL